MPSCSKHCMRAGFDAMSSLRTAMAFSRAIARELPRRKGIFRKRSVCRDCGGDLILGDPGHTHTFALPIPDGPALEVSMTGPCLVCVSCGRRHLNFPEGKGLEDLSAPVLGVFGEAESDPPRSED